MDDLTQMEEVLHMARRLHGIATRLAPEDPALAEMADALEEAQHALDVLRQQERA